MSLSEEAADRKSNNDFYSLHCLIRRVECHGHKFPLKILSALKELCRGISFDTVCEKFGMDKKILLRALQVTRNMGRKSIEEWPQLIAKLESSFSGDLRESSDEGDSFEGFSVESADSRGSSILNKEALTALQRGELALSVNQRFKMPSGTLSHRYRSSRRFLSSYKRRRKEVDKEKKPLLCLFCHRPDEREIEFGKLHVSEEIAAHYYCLLFSSALEQNGKDDEGIMGFLPKDILKELNRGLKLKCRYCGRKGATIGCNNKQCKKTYHFPCGLDKFALYVFTDNFSSLCVNHRKFQNGCSRGSEVECPICLEKMVADPRNAVWSPCCKRSTWFHRLCLQKLAVSSGYFFKCPLCNDRTSFVNEMMKQGIYVPEQDASWELEPNAFQELLERPSKCEAIKCKCPSGRLANKVGCRWELLMCSVCGSSARHFGCVSLPPRTREWNCDSCCEMLQVSSRRMQLENRGQRALGRKRKCDDISLPEEGVISPHRMLLGSPKCSSRLSDSNTTVSEDCNIVIRKLEAEGQTLPPELQEMKDYAQLVLFKMVKLKSNENEILHIINSEVPDGMNCITIDHIKQFIRYNYNLDQMCVFRRILELAFAIKENINEATRRKNVSIYRSLLHKTLVSVRDTGIMDENQTLTDSRLFEVWKNEAPLQEFHSLLKSQIYQSLPFIFSVLKMDDEDAASTSSDDTPYRYIRIVQTTLDEKCSWCNMQLKPGTHSTTVKLSIGELQIICPFCLTCNTVQDLFPKVNWMSDNSLKEADPYVLSFDDHKVITSNIMPSDNDSEIADINAVSSNTVQGLFPKVNWMSDNSLKEADPYVLSFDDHKVITSNIMPSDNDSEIADINAVSNLSDIQSKPNHQKQESDTTLSDCFIDLSPIHGDSEPSTTNNAPEPAIIISLSDEEVDSLDAPMQLKKPEGISALAKSTPDSKNAGASESSSCEDNEASITKKKENDLTKEGLKAPDKPQLHKASSYDNSGGAVSCIMCDFSGSRQDIHTVQCDDCQDKPAFCSLYHFDLWHTISHNWMVIPSTEHEKEPKKRCKNCTTLKVTRYCCPGCPTSPGFCSWHHYEMDHSSKPSKMDEYKEIIDANRKMASSLRMVRMPAAHYVKNTGAP